MRGLDLHLEYEWEPFMVDRKHCTFNELSIINPLRQNMCSHQGAAVYKWEGVLSRGPNSGKVGVLIGEAVDIRKRIKKYINGPQPNGNARWREDFLRKGEIRLYILELKTAKFRAEDDFAIDFNPKDFSGENRRLMYEKVLVTQEVERCNPEIWIVNREI